MEKIVLLFRGLRKPGILLNREARQKTFHLFFANFARSLPPCQRTSLKLGNCLLVTASERSERGSLPANAGDCASGEPRRVPSGWVSIRALPSSTNSPRNDTQRQVSSPFWLTVGSYELVLHSASKIFRCGRDSLTHRRSIGSAGGGHRGGAESVASSLSR